MIIQKNIYSDLPMFIEPNPFDGDMSIKTDRNAIRESIRNCILTANGERPFEFLFGTNIQSSMFESLDDFKFNADGELATSIYQNDQRIILGKRNYTLSDQTMTISFDYQIKSLNVRESIKISLERTR